MLPLPINNEDAAPSDIDIDVGEQVFRANQDTPLARRAGHLRTPADYGLFHIKSKVANIFREFLSSEGFIEHIVPTYMELMPGLCGGSTVFKLDYDLERVFKLSFVLRANKSPGPSLHEFTGLDAEMKILQSYMEVIDIVDRLFVKMFDTLNAICKKELNTIGRQCPFEPLKYLQKTLTLTFEEGVQMLKDAEMEVDPFGDLNTEAETKLGQLVLEKYGTEVYILYRYPICGRPFYTMPCSENLKYSNLFDVFMRGMVHILMECLEPD